MFGIGVTELGIILVVALLVFGPKRLPELARLLGRGMGEFRRASHELRQSLALDDLQSDLRRGLDQAGRIHKPVSPPDRPAQAGDDLATDGTTDDATEDAMATGTPTGTPTGAEEPKPSSESDPAAASPSSARHPGELPLGNDHEHHDLPDTADDTSDGASDGAPDRPAGAESANDGSVPHESRGEKSAYDEGPRRADGPRRIGPSGSERG